MHKHTSIMWQANSSDPAAAHIAISLHLASHGLMAEIYLLSHISLRFYLTGLFSVKSVGLVLVVCLRSALKNAHIDILKNQKKCQTKCSSSYF